MVVLTGAGISAECGLRTFRDSDGLWEGYNVYEVATPGAWRKNPQLVLDFYNMRRRDVAAANPNRAHHVLAELEEKFEVQIITQNIDDLHERAGSTKVLHLHGEIFKMRSETNPDLIYEIRGDMLYGERAEDGGILRPHIVWFEEEVPMIVPASEICAEADLFLVVGTSLVVYPAAGLIRYTPYGIPQFVVDRKIPNTTEMSDFIVFEKPATEGMEELKELLLSMSY